MPNGQPDRHHTLNRRRSTLLGALLVLSTAAAPLLAEEATQEAATAPPIRSMSAIAFNGDGVLFIGDGKGGAVWALELGAAGEDAGTAEGIQLPDIERRIGARLGTSADGVMIHDMDVHPKTGAVYLAVSRGRADWASRWSLPNDVADATILLEVRGDGEIREVPLTGVAWTRAELPSPVDAEKAHPWKEGTLLRADTITDLAFDDGTLYVAGLSNEEFASTMWRLPYPFADASMTTLEIFHGAHGEYETHAPIRTFVPYTLAGKRHLLAAYLCTPFVTFPLDGLKDGEHLKGRTVAEFGSGNYPLDMVPYEREGEGRLLIANSNLPLMIVDPKDIERFEGEIVTESKTYAEGVPYEIRSGAGVQQLALLNPEHFVALARSPNGALNLVSLPVRRF